MSDPLPKIDPETIPQDIQLKLVAVLIARVSGASSTQKLVGACGLGLFNAIMASGFVVEIQAIAVSEVEPAPVSGRTQ